MNLVEVSNICKTYGRGDTAVKALRDVSFPFQKANMWRLWENPVPARVRSLT